MSDDLPTPDARYAALVDALLAEPGVTAGSEEGQPRHRFGASGLKVGGKLFAMLVRGALVLKLPRRRVDALVTSGDGERYDPRRDGRRMQEWLVLAPTSALDWLPLAREALAFVGGKG